MWKYLVLFAGFLAVSVYVSVEYQNHAEITPNQTAQPSNKVVKPSAQVDQGKENQNQPEWNAPRWYGFFIWPEGITVWALFLTLFAIAEQTQYTGRAVRHAIHSERAWIMDSHVGLVAGAKDAPEGIDQVYIQCNARNAGKTPARVLGFNALLKAGPISEPGETWDDSLYNFTQKKPRTTILPEHNSALHFAVGGIKGSPGGIISAPCGPGESFFIHGVIRYWDMFTKEDRFTRFCYRQKDGIPGHVSVYERAGGDLYNQQT